MRFYVSPESIFPDKNLIEVRDRDEVHHIRDVMRLKEGIKVTVFDGRGKEYSGSIKDVSKHSVIIDIESSADLIPDIPYKLTLYQAIPKKNKMDFIVEKAVELGADAIIPILTERTVPAIKDNAQKKRDRWSRIARAASKQCGRSVLPEVLEVVDFNSALAKAAEGDLIIFAALDKDARPLKTILRDKNPKKISVFVGPEGDFSEAEISLAREKDCSMCSLGPSVLRSETAAIYILSSISYEYTFQWRRGGPLCGHSLYRMK